MCPPKTFFIADKTWRELKFPKKGGISPLRLLARRARYSSFDKEASSFGIDPESLFLLTLIILMLEQWERFAGISPWKELLDNHNTCNLKRRPTSSGILPPMVLLLSLITLMKLRLPMYGDKEPTKPLILRSNTVTLLCLRLHVTPSHSQKWRESFHELKTFSGSVWISFILLKLKSYCKKYYK